MLKNSILLPLIVVAGTAVAQDLFVIPDFEGLDQGVASGLLRKNGIVFEISEAGDCPTSFVTRQSPDAGLEIDVNREIIFLQTGLGKVVVPPANTPNLERVLKALDLVVSTTVEDTPAPSVHTSGALICLSKSTRITGTHPQKGSTLCPGSKVTILSKVQWGLYDCR